MFWKKKKVDDEQISRIILGMVILQDETPVDLKNFLKDFSHNYGDIITELTGDNSACVFTVDQEKIAIGFIGAPIPQGDIEGTAQYSYNWQTALEDTKDHKSHIIVSVMKGGVDQKKRYKIFTQVLCSLLRTTNAIGVYKGNQSLLIPKNDYLSEAGFMSDDYLPVNLWIYFGLRVSSRGNSGYTYGLKEFGKEEIEIVNSLHNLEEIREFLFNIASYVLDYDVIFQDGQTVGGSEDDKIAISWSKGQFVEGKSFKLAY
jgi:hypothetical protein